MCKRKGFQMLTRIISSKSSTLCTGQPCLPSGVSVPRARWGQSRGGPSAWARRLRGRRSIWWSWRMTPVAPRIVYDVSYATDINHVNDGSYVDPRHIWNVIYNVRSNRGHNPTSPNTAPQRLWPCTAPRAPWLKQWLYEPQVFFLNHFICVASKFRAFLALFLPPQNFAPFFSDPCACFFSNLLSFIVFRSFFCLVSFVLSCL